MSGRTLPRLVLALVLVSFTLYAIADANLLVLVPGVPAAIVGWAISRRRERAMPRALTAALVIGAILNAARGVMLDGMDVTDFCQFVVLIMLIKVFDKRAARDDAQIITLSTFLTIGAILTSADFLPGLLVLIFIPLLIITAIRFQFHAGIERSNAFGIERGLAPVSRDPARLTGLGGVVVLSLVVGAGISAAVFVLMPRGLGADAFGRWTRVASGTRTGFSDRVRLGGEGLISESQQIVLDLAIRDSNNMSVGGPNEVFYLRGAVLDLYEGGSWVRSPVELKRMNVEPGDAMPFGRAEGEVVDLVQTITIRHMPRDRAYLFAAWKPVHLKFGQRCRLLYDPGARTFVRSGDPGKFEYVVQSIRQVRVPETRYPPAEKVVSFDSEPVADLARQILRDAAIDPDAIAPDQVSLAARSIENHLRTNYAYSLEMRRPLDATDPIEWFLFQSKVGHCEYFASAMAALVKSLGIDARVVTGYVAAEWIPESMHYVVREANAHAWVEAEIRPNVWHTYDPTPPADLIEIHKPKRGLLARIAQMIDAVEYAWIRSIVGFDEQSRLRLIGGGGGDLASAASDRSNAPLLLSPDRIRRALERAIAAFAISACIGLAGLALLARLRASRRDPWNDLHDLPPLAIEQAECYRQLLSILKRLGVPKPTSLPPLAHVRRALAHDPAARAASERIVNAFYELRFARAPLPPERMERVRRDLQALRFVAPLPTRASENRPARSAR